MTLPEAIHAARIRAKAHKIDAYVHTSPLGGGYNFRFGCPIEAVSDSQHTVAIIWKTGQVFEVVGQIHDELILQEAEKSGLQVWRSSGYNSAIPGQLELVVAARSRAAAARLFGCSSTYLAKYGSITGNVESVRAAMSQPGTVFGKSYNNHSASYIALDMQGKGRNG